jgi:hypothetical protein
MRCDFNVGPSTRCATALEVFTDRIGRVIVRCPQCERRKAGLCRHCPKPVIGTRGKALYCAGCRAAMEKVRCARWYNRNLEHARECRRASAARQAARKREGKPQLSPREHARNRGLATAAAMSPEQRKARATKATLARWAKVRAAQAAA